MWKVPHIALKQSCNCYLITLYTILLFKENSKGGNIFTFIYISLFINLNYFLGFIFLFLLSSFSRYFSNQHIFLIFIYLDNTMFYLTFWKENRHWKWCSQELFVSLSLCTSSFHSCMCFTLFWRDNIIISKYIGVSLCV